MRRHLGVSAIDLPLACRIVTDNRDAQLRYSSQKRE